MTLNFHQRSLGSTHNFHNNQNHAASAVEAFEKQWDACARPVASRARPQRALRAKQSRAELVPPLAALQAAGTPHGEALECKCKQRCAALQSTAQAATANYRTPAAAVRKSAILLLGSTTLPAHGMLRYVR